jgi:signal transduction histidine kinase
VKPVQNKTPASKSHTPADLSDLLAQVEALQSQIDDMRKLLAESQRLATIGTIAAVIAHEFNNLLTPIVSYAHIGLQSIRSDNPDLGLIEKALGKASSGGEKAGRICASMLGLARGQSGFGPVEIYRLVEEVLSVLARDPAKDGINLKVNIQHDLKAMGDSVQLEQVLLNLLINARQAMLGAGGSLSIRAEPDADKAEVVLCVSDTGSGIAPEHLSRIFEPFFTTKLPTAPVGSQGSNRNAPQTGTGLGLAICKEIVEAHHGSISVDSAPGRGTTFIVRLPAAA